VLIVSKVANFAVDLPDANVAIQVSGTYRSRQEETQRLGRVLRPKPGENCAWFYSVVTKDTKDQECAKKRATFLTEQGYRYRLVAFEDDATTFEPAMFDPQIEEDAIIDARGRAETSDIPLQAIA
jgi:DNA excision repair protein ERCC-3